MNEINTSICAWCGQARNLDTELMMVRDRWGNLELRCSQCVDGEEIRNATDWIGDEIDGLMNEGHGQP